MEFQLKFDEVTINNGKDKVRYSETPNEVGEYVIEILATSPQSTTEIKFRRVNSSTDAVIQFTVKKYKKDGHTNYVSFSLPIQFADRFIENLTRESVENYTEADDEQVVVRDINSDGYTAFRLYSKPLAEKWNMNIVFTGKRSDCFAEIQRLENELTETVQNGGC